MCQNSLARLTYVSLNSLYPFLSEMSTINELRSPKSPLKLLVIINHHGQLQPTKYLTLVLLSKRPELSKFSEILNASVNQIQSKPLYNLTGKIKTLGS